MLTACSVMYFSFLIPGDIFIFDENPKPVTNER